MKFFAFLALKKHLVITLSVLFIVTALMFFYIENQAQTLRDANRLSSAKLIIFALENFHTNFEKYPEILEEIAPFLSPLPTDPQTKNIFEYKKTDTGFELIIPQEKEEEVIFKN